MSNSLQPLTAEERLQLLRKARDMVVNYPITTARLVEWLELAGQLSALGIDSVRVIEALEASHGPLAFKSSGPPPQPTAKTPCGQAKSKPACKRCGGRKLRPRKYYPNLDTTNQKETQDEK